LEEIVREVVALGEGASSNCDLVAQADRVSSFGLVVGLAVDALGMAM
jgi:hypothetical protein